MPEQKETQESIEEDLLEKTTARIEALGISSDDSPAEETDETEDSTSETESESEVKDEETEQTEETDETENSTLEDETEDSTSETESESESKDEDKEEEQTEEKIELPDAYYRAAVHRGWKPEEIKEFFVATPEIAKRTFANIYESVNQSSKEFADLGRLKLKQQHESTKHTQEQETEFKGVDVDKLRETYGKEEPLVDVVSAILEQNKLLHKQAQEQASQQQTQVSDKELKVLGEQIDGFFVADDLKLYEDFYGPGKNATGNITQPDELTPGQKANRAALLQIGDEIITGNAMQGYEMPVVEALGLAHLRITAPIKEQKIREDIMSKVVKRSKSITLKGSGKKAVTKKEPFSEAALEEKTNKRILELLRK